MHDLFPYLEIYRNDHDQKDRNELDYRDRNFNFEDLRVVVEFWYTLNQRFSENLKLDANFNLFFQEEPEYRNDILFQPILTIAPNKISSITQNIIKDQSFLLTSSSLLQISDGTNIIQQIYGLSNYYKYKEVFLSIFKGNTIQIKRFELDKSIQYNVLPIFITKWNDQSKFQSTQGDKQLQTRNYLNIVTEVSLQTPDGIVVYLPDVKTMKVLSEINEIQKQGQLQKPVFFENPNSFKETQEILQYYKQSIDYGIGGIFFCVARGIAAKNFKFNDQYGRCVLILGYPERQYNQYFFKGNQPQLLNISKSEFITFDTMNAVAQCLQSVYTYPQDYGIMILADEKLKKQCEYLPQWVKQNLKWQDEMTVNDFLQTILFYYRVMGKKYQ